MAPSLRILITNNTLDTRAGSELFVRDLALGLLRRGHSPIAYSPRLGAVAEDLRRASVPVVDDLTALSVAPDVIHGQHHLDAVTAMLRFPQVPALYMCHGWLPWEERPPSFPSIVRYVAVDDLCRERLETTAGIAAAQVRTIYNAVDLQRFTPRPPLPDRPRTALIFSNYATEDRWVGAIRAACQAFQIESVHVVGLGSGHSEPRPEAILPGYDVVFAKARCALEAMAVGCAVIVADGAGLGGLVTPENVARLRRLNFGLRTLQALPVTPEAVLGELRRFDAQRSREVSTWIRAHASADAALDQLETTYAELAAQRAAWSPGHDLAACAAASNYLVGLARMIKDSAAFEYRATARAEAMAHEITELSRARDAWLQEQQALVAARDAGIRERETLLSDREDRIREQDNLRHAYSALMRETARVSDERDECRRGHERLESQLHVTQTELHAVLTSKTWRSFMYYRHLRRWLHRW